MTLCKVYKHTLNDKIYIGQTWQILKNRTDSGRGYKSCTHFYNAIKKYGWKNVKTEILALCAEQKEADFLEDFYIKEFQSWKRECGYNLKFGGSHGRASEESKQKMSKAKKGKVFSDETKQNMSKAKKGKVLSDETKQKISIAQKGRVVSDETKQKISIAQKGRVVSDETKQKISAARKGVKKTK